MLWFRYRQGLKKHKVKKQKIKNNFLFLFPEHILCWTAGEGLGLIFLCPAAIGWGWLPNSTKSSKNRPGGPGLKTLPERCVLHAFFYYKTEARRERKSLNFLANFSSLKCMWCWCHQPPLLIFVKIWGKNLDTQVWVWSPPALYRTRFPIKAPEIQIK